MDFDLTPPQFALLAFLWKQDGLSQTVLGSMAGMDRTTVSGIIDRLEKQGLVERRDDPQDRRSYLIYLTAQGRAYKQKATGAALKTNAAISEKLSPDEKECLVELLTKMLG